MTGLIIIWKKVIIIPVIQQMGKKKTKERTKVNFCTPKMPAVNALASAGLA